MEISSDTPPPIIIGSLRIGSQAGFVAVSGRSIHVTPLEFDLLMYLGRRAGQSVPVPELLHAVWCCRAEDGGTEAQVKNVIYRLRKRIEPDHTHPRYILNKRGFGYCIPRDPDSNENVTSPDN